MIRCPSRRSTARRALAPSTGRRDRRTCTPGTSDPGRAQQRHGVPVGLRCVQVWYRTCSSARWSWVLRRLTRCAACSVFLDAWIAAATMERVACSSGRARAVVGRNQSVGSRIMPSTWARAADSDASAVKLTGEEPMYVLYAAGRRPCSRARRTIVDSA